MTEARLLRNAMRTPDGTLLESNDRHDYRTHVDKNGEKYMVDGGLDYVRRTINKEPAEDLSLTEDDPHDILRDIPIWGTYGINGDQPRWRISVAEMDKGHLEAVIKIPGIYPQIRKLMKDELTYRGEQS